MESAVKKIVKKKKEATEATAGEKVSLILEEMPIKEIWGVNAIITKFGHAAYCEMEKLIHSRESDIEQLAIEAMEYIAH